MMEQIESNDLGFTATWSSAVKMKCGTLFFNPSLPDDVFFDKLSDITCLSEETIDQAVDLLKKNCSVPCVYSVNYAELETLLEKKGFTEYDTQHAMIKRPMPQKKSNVVQITPSSIAVWVDVFCKAYGCPGWEMPLFPILESSLGSVDYFVDESKSSCMALYEKGSVLGLYCLGTVPEKRNQGIAASLIGHALNEAYSRNLDYLVLETYERDNLVGFYSHLGFESAYCKKVYSI